MRYEEEGYGGGDGNGGDGGDGGDGIVEYEVDPGVSKGDSKQERSIYWELKEAANLFGFEYGDNVFEGLKLRIHLLSDAIDLLILRVTKILLMEKVKLYQFIKYSTLRTRHYTLTVHMILLRSSLEEVQ
jgi:hypothetical protein